jgi:hypothetical protein
MTSSSLVHQRESLVSMVGSVQAGLLESWLGHAYDPVTPNIDYYSHCVQ